MFDHVILGGTTLKGNANLGNLENVCNFKTCSCSRTPEGISPDIILSILRLLVCNMNLF